MPLFTGATGRHPMLRSAGKPQCGCLRVASIAGSCAGRFCKQLLPNSATVPRAIGMTDFDTEVAGKEIGRLQRRAVRFRRTSLRHEAVAERTRRRCQRCIGPPLPLGSGDKNDCATGVDRCAGSG